MLLRVDVKDRSTPVVAELRVGNYTELPFAAPRRRDARAVAQDETQELGTEKSDGLTEGLLKTEVIDLRASKSFESLENMEY